MLGKFLSYIRNEWPNQRGETAVVQEWLMGGYKIIVSNRKSILDDLYSTNMGVNKLSIWAGPFLLILTLLTDPRLVNHPVLIQSSVMIVQMLVVSKQRN